LLHRAFGFWAFLSKKLKVGGEYFSPRAMSGRANMMGWEFMDRIVILGTLIAWLWGLYKTRGRVWKSVKWLTVKGFGLTASFSGVVVLGSDGWAIWNFARFLSFESPSSVIGSSLGATIGAMLFAGLGAYALAGGVWLTIPNTRLGKCVKRRFFRRAEYARKPTFSHWDGLKRVPAAGILRFFSGSR
jgi:hypothetical protein